MDLNPYAVELVGMALAHPSAVSAEESHSHAR